MTKQTEFKTLAQVNELFAEANTSSNNEAGEQALADGCAIAECAFRDPLVAMQEKLAIGQAYIGTFDGTDDAAGVAQRVLQHIAEAA